MFRSFLLTLVLQQLSVEVYIGNRDFNYDPSFVRLTNTSLPESVNISQLPNEYNFHEDYTAGKWPFVSKHSSVLRK